MLNIFNTCKLNKREEPIMVIDRSGRPTPFFDKPHPNPQLTLQQPKHTPQPKQIQQIQQPQQPKQIQQPKHTPQPKQPKQPKHTPQPKQRTPQPIQQPKHTPQPKQPKHTPQPKHTSQPKHTPQPKQQQPSTSNKSSFVLVVVGLILIAVSYFYKADLRIFGIQPRQQVGYKHLTGGGEQEELAREVNPQSQEALVQEVLQPATQFLRSKCAIKANSTLLRAEQVAASKAKLAETKRQQQLMDRDLRDLQKQRDRELKQQQRDLKQRKREQQEIQQQRDLQLKQQREIQQRDLQLQQQRDRELQLQQELKQQQDRELQLQRDLQQQRDLQLKQQRDREQREIQLQQELQLQRDLQLQQELKQQREIQHSPERGRFSTRGTTSRSRSRSRSANGDLKLEDSWLGRLYIDESLLKSGTLEATIDGECVLSGECDQSLYDLLTKRFVAGTHYTPYAIETFARLVQLAGLNPHGRRRCKKAELILPYIT
jgi:hypothetical protein